MYFPEVTVIIPAYNEEKTIAGVISDTTQVMETLDIPYEIIVVDDGSTDKTRQMASHSRATVLSNQENRGKGYALRKALQYAHGDIIVTIDADGEHKPKEIPDLINPLLSGADIVSGSRFLGTQSEVTTIPKTKWTSNRLKTPTSTAKAARITAQSSSTLRTKRSTVIGMK